MSDPHPAHPAQPGPAYLQRWLKFAPKPPERGNRAYDTFISYRSSDRPWAMALYDALKLAGWEPFLDQFALIPGSNLRASLEKGLLASSSGVILWSSRTPDSRWCERERDTMVALKDRAGSSFHFVWAKLDHEELPPFGSLDLYVGFEDSPEGPRGVKLLELMCGMRNVPVDEEARRLAEKVDEDARQTMIAIRGAIRAGNAARLKEIGMSQDPGVLASPARVLEAAQGLISLKKCDDALEVLEQALTHFPGSLRAKQLKGLALRRLDRFQEAIDVLAELEAAGHQDAETLGILAAAWDGLSRGPAGTRLHLRTSRELYRKAFQADPTSYYTGINAAAKSLFLGEPDEAARLAGEVFPLVKDMTEGRDLWGGCTLGEVYLLQGNVDEAAKQYQKMIDTYPTCVGDLLSTGSQAKRICEALKMADEQAATVLAPFTLLDA
jgi:tetratricopeptide (TPR) repeat protein